MSATNITSLYLRNSKKELMGLLLALSVIFVISPLAGMIITLFLAWLLNTWKLAKFSTLILVVFLWCIESTRTFSIYEEGDFPAYMSMFLDLGKVPLLRLLVSPSSAGLEESIEYGWMVLNRVGFALFNGNFFHFVYCLIACSYLLIFTALYKFYQSIKANCRYYLCSIVFLAFLSSYFSMINNILSQQVAVSLVIYTLAVKVVDKKFKWYFWIIAVLIHTMCLAFFPLFFFKFDKKPSLKTLAIVTVLFVAFYMLVQRFDMLSLINITFIQRFANSSSYLGADVIDSNVVFKYVVIVAFIYCIIVLFRKNVHPYVIAMMNITLLMSLLYIIMTPLPLIQTRYYITRLVFLPFVVPLVFNKNNILGDIYTICLSCIICVSFFSGDYPNFKMNFDELFNKCLFEYNIL